VVDDLGPRRREPTAAGALNLLCRARAPTRRQRPRRGSTFRVADSPRVEPGRPKACRSPGQRPVQLRDASSANRRAQMPGLGRRFTERGVRRLRRSEGGPASPGRFTRRAARSTSPGLRTHSRERRRPVVDKAGCSRLGSGTRTRWGGRRREPRRWPTAYIIAPSVAYESAPATTSNPVVTVRPLFDSVRTHQRRPWRRWLLLVVDKWGQ
jgi:hypothetical protein